MLKIAAIIPAYNEEKSIADVVGRIVELRKRSGINIWPVVVNDCSLDQTGAIINKLDCIALQLPVNLGIGGAVQTGFLYALRNEYNVAIQVDGDGQHPVEEISKLTDKISSGEADVVIGSRFITHSGFQSSFFRRIGIRYFSFLNKFLTGIMITDNTSGFRAINKRALELVCDYYPDDYPEPEAVILFALNNLKIREVPVEMSERQGGRSSIGYFSGIYYMVKVSIAIFTTYLRLKRKKS